MINPEDIKRPEPEGSYVSVKNLVDCAKEYNLTLIEAEGVHREGMTLMEFEAACYRLAMAREGLEDRDA